MINFVGGGRIGDYIHTLYVVKNLCAERSEKANLYMAEGGDTFKFGLQRAFDDVRSLIVAQPYINTFSILPSGLIDPIIDLNTWRVGLDRNPSTGSYALGWSDLLSSRYGFSVPSEYKWLSADAIDDLAKDKVLIHRSTHHHNTGFPWAQVIDASPYSVLFVTSNQEEWDAFPLKSHPRVSLHLVPNIKAMAEAMASCRFFIGNQSSPFALASALDVPRLVELDYDPAGFYTDERKYSQNISWFLNHSSKHFSNDAVIKI